MKKLSEPQRAVLRHLADGGVLEAHGQRIGAGSIRVRYVTLFALWDRGLVSAVHESSGGGAGFYHDWQITDEGRQALDASD